MFASPNLDKVKISQAETINKMLSNNFKNCKKETKKNLSAWSFELHMYTKFRLNRTLGSGSKFICKI